MKRTRKGEATIAVILLVALLGVGTWLAKPSWFPGGSKRAAQSTQATANLTAATQAADAKLLAQSAAAAASVVKIGEANAAAPESPSKEFIGKEVTVAQSRLPAPDPAELIAAEKRRAAVMEGQRDEARRLYEQAAKDSTRLQSERDAAVAAREAATREREAIDVKLKEAAAAEHARSAQMLGLLLLAGVFAAGWIYTKVFSITPATIGNIAADIRSGTAPLQALDTHLAPRLHARIRRAAQLATDPKEPAR